MDYSVVMQVVRRGGPRSGKPIPPAEVNSRLSQLRAQAQAEADSRGGPLKKGEGPERLGFEGPEGSSERPGGEYGGPVTEMQELAPAMPGADRQPHRGWIQGRALDPPRLPDDAGQLRAQRTQEPEETGDFEALNSSSPIPASHARTRALEASLGGGDRAQSTRP